MGVNAFSALTLEGFAKHFTMANYTLPPSTVPPATFDVPNGVDWRGRLPGVKQQRCGDCWAFATTASVDFFGGSHSEQQLVDCTGGGCGCGGGNAPSAYNYLERAGDESESAYPYRGSQGSCNYRSSGVTAHVRSFQSLGGEGGYASAINRGVIVVYVRAKNQAWKNYRGGQLTPTQISECGDALDHAVNLVGVSNGNWIIRNSWGSGWGDGGYMLAPMNKGVCGLGSDGYIPSDGAAVQPFETLV